MHILPSNVVFGPLERTILGILWTTSTPLTVKQIHANLGGSDIKAYTTIMTTCGRMAEKGLLTREQLLAYAGAPFHYGAALSKAALLAASIAELRDRLDVNEHEWNRALVTLGVVR